MNKLLILCFLFCSFCISTKASDSTSFLSKIYLPCNWGFSNTFSNQLSSGFLFKTGIEYRLNTNQGLFIQFNMDNHSNGFKNTIINLTNVNKGIIRFGDYTIGIGNRIGSRKYRGYGLLQGGTTVFNYPVVNFNQLETIVNEKNNSMLILKSSVGFEYYIVESLCLVLDISYAIIPKEVDFWDKPCQFYSVSLGLTTKLF